jgi:hypothetical protein
LYGRKRLLHLQLQIIALYLNEKWRLIYFNMKYLVEDLQEMEDKTCQVAFHSVNVVRDLFFIKNKVEWQL